MKSTVKLTFSAIMAATAATVMLTSLFPYLTIAIPAVASLFIMVTVIEAGILWGFASYAVSAALVLILPGDIEAKAIYIAVAGYYPALKAVIETKFKRTWEYPIKFIVIFIAICITLNAVGKLFGINLIEMENLDRWDGRVATAVAIAVFFIYDAAITKMSGWYITGPHKSVMRIFRK